MSSTAAIAFMIGIKLSLLSIALCRAKMISIMDVTSASTGSQPSSSNSVKDDEAVENKAYDQATFRYRDSSHLRRSWGQEDRRGGPVPASHWSCEPLRPPPLITEPVSTWVYEQRKQTYEVQAKWKDIRRSGSAKQFRGAQERVTSRG